MVDNGPARNARNAETLQEGGALIGDPFEISTLRREDFKMVKGKAVGDDVLQCNSAASSRSPRGHQCE